MPTIALGHVSLPKEDSSVVIISSVQSAKFALPSTCCSVCNVWLPSWHAQLVANSVAVLCQEATAILSLTVLKQGSPLRASSTLAWTRTHATFRICPCPDRQLCLQRLHGPLWSGMSCPRAQPGLSGPAATAKKRGHVCCSSDVKRTMHHLRSQRC